MRKINAQNGFTYIDTLISMVILVTAILAAISAMTYAIVFTQISEKKTKAKSIGSSAIESIFAVRDMNSNGVLGWDLAQNKSSGSGIFLTGWTPVRESPGFDGIYGTDDDACAGTGACIVNGKTNNSPLMDDFQRKIEITNIVENNAVNKRRIEVTISYNIKNIKYYEKTSTVIANIPFE